MIDTALCFSSVVRSYCIAPNFRGTKISWNTQNLWNYYVKNFVIAAKSREAWRGLIVAVVPRITASLCLFLGCVLLIRSSFGWFCGRLGRWVACSLRLFCHAFVGRLASPIQKDGIHNERGPVGLVTLPSKGWISWRKPAESYFYQNMFNVQCVTHSAREKACPQKLRGQSRNSWKYYSTKIWSSTVCSQCC